MCPARRNTIGIKNPAVDALIDKVIFAKDRAELVAATKALDRVLLWNFYVVPQFTYRLQRAMRAGIASATPSVAEIRPLGPPVPVVVRRRQGRQDRQEVLRDLSRMALLSRRHVLGLGAGAFGAAFRRGSGCGRRCRPMPAPRPTGISAFGDLKYPADFQHFDYVNPAAPKGGMFSLIPSVRAYNQSYQTFNSLQCLHPQRRRRAGHGHDVRAADGARRRRARCDVWPRGEISADFAGQTDLSLHDAARGAISRRLQTDGAGCRVLADDAEGQRPSADHAADARHGEGGGGRRRDADRHLRRKARARRAALCRGPADLLEGLLRGRGRSTN